MATATSRGEWRRITIVTEEAFEKLMIDQALKRGVNSYICTYCSGKPLHEAFEKSLASQPLVRIELLARPAVAEALAGDLQRLEGLHYPVMALVDEVAVCAGRAPELVGTNRA